MIKKYIAYLKDNPKHYWFKRKVFGWGWVPVTWEGFATIFVYVLLLVFVSIRLDKVADSPSNVTYQVVIPFVILTAILIKITYWKGEKPKWQWGIPKK
jgi:hypothetical protein